MGSHWRILVPLLTVVAGILWHFTSGLISGVPFGELLQWESALDSVLRVRQVVLFPVTVAGALISWGIIGISVCFGLGIFLIGTPYMFYLKWREKRRWTEVSRQAKERNG